MSEETPIFDIYKRDRPTGTIFETYRRDPLHSEVRTPLYSRPTETYSGARNTIFETYKHITIFETYRRDHPRSEVHAFILIIATSRQITIFESCKTCSDEFLDVL